MNDVTSSPEESATEKRSALVAGILGFLLLGLGFVYAGKGRLALLTPIVFLLIVGLFTWTRLVLLPIWYLLLCACLMLLWIFVIYLSCRYASRANAEPNYWYQRWYVYVLLIIMSQGFSWAMGGNLRPAVFGFETYRIPSGSMQPTLMVGDFVLTDSWELKSRDLSVGDIVTFTRNSQSYIKRVIGLPGDKVDIVNGSVFVSGRRIDEPYVNPNNNKRSAESFTTVVPDGQYFVLGDNRDNSSDSRFWGYVPRENIRGTLTNIWLSYNKKGVDLSRIGIVD